MVALAAAVVGNLDAQLISNPQSIPDTGKPPVVLLNGYQAGCGTTSSFSGTFGIADEILQRDRRVSLFFDNCAAAKNASIEEIGNAFRDFLEGLRYNDGRPVPQVDVVAHSMGGDIVRSYLAGKQTTRGVFQAPVNVKIRKAVFIAVPFFGSIAAELSGNDVQSTELRPGSAFLFDLATWNQGQDDLRGIDAVAVAATGGTGLQSLKPGFDDSTVTVTSASLEFARLNHTRVVPNYCHTTLAFPLSFACFNPTQAIAKMTSDQQETARIMISFLNGTSEWMNVGTAPSDNGYLKEYGGLEFQIRDAQDQLIQVNSANKDLKIRSGEVVWTDYLAPQKPFEAMLTIPGGTATTRIDETRPGYTQSVISVTGGPVIGGIIPNFADTYPRAMAPGSFFSMYGTNLSSSTDTATTTPYPQSLAGVEVRINDQQVALQYVSPTQINAVIPDSALGSPRIVVRSPSGQRALNILVEPAVPSLYTNAVNAVTNALITTAAPAHPGDYISIYGTGLGQTEMRDDGLNWARIQPVVTVGGQPCVIQYAGRAPGFVGLDQINCQIAPGATPSDSTEVVVASGNRSAALRIPLR